MKIYALLVGINNYNEIPKLEGCTGDIEKIEKYLLYSNANCEIEKLLDDKATKSGIINRFGKINQKISDNDTFLLYFSGHGTREKASPLWKEPNDKLECIVCYDEEDSESDSDFLLADKELRYLISELSKTGCHIVTIFDCCHSGGNTRNFGPVSAAFDEQVVKERRYAISFPQRKWEEFIFSKKINESDVKGKSVNEFLPQGRHVQIAACESDEAALEADGEGVFTKTLLKVLKDSGGKISYYDLRSRIRQYLRFVYKQQPRIYTIGATDEETQSLLYTRFLKDQHIDEQQFIAEAVYNRKAGWLLNFGAIHGVNQNTTVELIDPVLPGKFYPARIKEVMVDHSILKLAEGASINPACTVCRAKVEGFELAELKLHIKNYGDNLKGLKNIADTLTAGAAGHYVLTDDEISADYSLHIRPGLMYITRPAEQFRPLTEPIEWREVNGRAITGVSRLAEFLRHISRWHYTQQLQNKKVFDVGRDLIKIDIVQMTEDSAEKIIPIKNNGQGIGYSALDPFVKSNIGIRLTNQSDQKLFIAVAYLVYNFKVDLKFLEDKVQLLNSGKSVSLSKPSRSSRMMGNELITIQLPAVVQEYNWPGYTETIKIIISREAFNPEAFSLDAIPAPYILKDRERTREIYRSASSDDEESTMNFTGWVTQTVHLEYPNIFYNKVEQAKINEMLQYNKMAFFAKGLYADNTGS